MASVDRRCEPIPADDRGFLFGDGVFETVVARQGRILWGDLHRDRLQRGISRLGLNADADHLLQALCKSAAASNAPWLALRLTVSRGSGPAGYAPDEASPGLWRISQRPLAADPLDIRPPAAVLTSDIVIAAQPLLAGIKHCNRLEQVMGARQAQMASVDDVLMCNADGQLQCSSKANLFVVTNGVLCTAPCDRQGIEGTRRQLILDTLAPALGIECRLQAASSSGLLASQGAFLCNSVMGIRAIKTVDSVALPQPPHISALQDRYRKAGLACVA